MHCVRLSMNSTRRHRQLIESTLRKLAEAMGVSTMTVSNYLTGKRPLTIAIALAFEEISGIPVRSFSDRLADEIEAAPHASQDDDQ